MVCVGAGRFYSEFYSEQLFRRVTALTVSGGTHGLPDYGALLALCALLSVETFSSKPGHYKVLSTNQNTADCSLLYP